MTNRETANLYGLLGMAIAGIEFAIGVIFIGLWPLGWWNVVSTIVGFSSCAATIFMAFRIRERAKRL